MERNFHIADLMWRLVLYLKRFFGTLKTLVIVKIVKATYQIYKHIKNFILIMYLQ